MTVSFDLAGRAAVVTGGSRGIGLAIAIALAEHGAQVTSWSRDLVSNRAAAKSFGGLAVRCDVTDRDEIERAMSETISHCGQVDILVANAGSPGEDVQFPANDAKDWDSILATNLTAVFNTVHAFSNHAVSRGGGGKIVIVSSVAAQLGLPRAIAYASAKSGLIGLCRSAAVALARHDIQVNCIEPGWTETEMTAPQFAEPRTASALLRHTPARRFAAPDDIAGVCVYLASSASDFHTGDIIRVDGGYALG